MADIKSSLFGQLAVRAGIVMQAQVDECLELQAKYTEAGRPAPKLGEILASKGYLSADQVRAIIQGKFSDPGKRFGEICVQMQFASLDHVKECLGEQSKLASPGPAPKIGMILAKHGYIKPHQISAVLEAQGVEVVWCPACDLHYNLAVAAAAEARKCSSCGGPLEAPSGPPPIDYGDDEPLDDEYADEEYAAGDEYDELEDFENLDEMEELGTIDAGIDTTAIEEVAPAPPAPAPAPAPAPPPVAVADPAAAVAVPMQQFEPAAIPANAKTNLMPAAGDDSIPAGAELTEIGGYRIIEEIGSDAQGPLFKADHESRGNTVALRVISETRTRDAEFYQRFSEEAKRAAALRHSGLKRIVSAGRDRGRLYYASEFVAGKSVRQLLAGGGHMPAKVATKIVRSVAETLAYGHSQGIIHGEIKPSNILLLPDGSVKLAEFGLYREPMANVEMLTRSYGVTPFYLAPEQAMVDPRSDSRTDIYSLGAVYYHMVTGHPPYEGNSSLEVMMRLTEEELSPPYAVNSAVPQPVGNIITKMMAVDPQGRHQSAEALIADLDRLGAPPAVPQAAAIPTASAVAGAAVPSPALEAFAPAPTEALSYPAEEATPDGFGGPSSDDIRQMVRANIPEQLPVKTRKRKPKKRRRAPAGGGRRRGRDEDYDDEDDRDRRRPVRRSDNTTTIGLVVMALFIVAAAIAIFFIMEKREEMGEDTPDATEDVQTRRQSIHDIATPKEEVVEEVPEDQRPRSLFDSMRSGGGD